MAMKKLAILLSAAFMLSALSLAASPQEDVAAAVRDYRQALLKKDVVALEKIWSDDYTFINGHGAVLTKADRIAEIKSGHSSLDSIKHEDEPVIRVHGDTALIFSHVTLVGKYSGREVSGEFRSLHVWISDNGRWRLVTNQLTPIAK
jgi:ketosteroid isomerase-like protein